MKKIYQSEWHAIPFKTFSKPSSSKMADASFYSSFYKAFFEKYKKWDDLDREWMDLKRQVGSFIVDRHSEDKDGRILSIGCGLGVVEKVLIDAGFNNLEVTEVSQDPLRWILPHIAAERAHIGLFPECLPNDRLYRCIYLSAAEYFFNQEQLSDVLKSVKRYLLPGGTCLMISVSFDFEKNADSLIKKIAKPAKDLAVSIFDALGIKERGQFWGYLRNRHDFDRVMKAAGFPRISEGFLEKKTRWDVYWCEGVNA